MEAKARWFNIFVDIKHVLEGKSSIPFYGSTTKVAFQRPYTDIKESCPYYSKAIGYNNNSCISIDYYPEYDGKEDRKDFELLTEKVLKEDQRIMIMSFHRHIRPIEKAMKESLRTVEKVREKEGKFKAFFRMMMIPFMRIFDRSYAKGGARVTITKTLFDSLFNYRSNSILVQKLIDLRIQVKVTNKSLIFRDMKHDKTVEILVKKHYINKKIEFVTILGYSIKGDVEDLYLLGNVSNLLKYYLYRMPIQFVFSGSLSGLKKKKIDKAKKKESKKA